MTEARYMEMVNSRLEALTSELNRLALLLGTNEGRDLRVDVQARLRELQAKFELAQGRLERLRNGRQGRLCEAQTGFRRAWVQLQSRCDGEERRH